MLRIIQRQGCIVFLLVASCQSTHHFTAEDYDYPQPFDTSDQPVEYQQKQVTHPQGTAVYFDNRFDGARLNEVMTINDTTFRLVIRPENQPINPSPWYAFKVWSEVEKTIYLQMDYSGYKHRYRPKISKNGSAWSRLDSLDVGYTSDSSLVWFRVKVDKDTTWLAGQEVVNSRRVEEWCKNLAGKKAVSYQVIGKSKQGKNLIFLDIAEGNSKGRPTVVVLSRQHPPEVTGYFAMQAFINEVLSATPLAEKFRKTYRLMVFPLLNPDGVDLGQWRHNTGGIDLNRDWAYYRQPEVREVADFIVDRTTNDKNNVVLGLDFHSTYHDVFYTNRITPESKFKDRWLNRLEELIPDYAVNEKASEIEKPVSKSWFYTQFGADGITYEIGDQTSREFIAIKGSASAKAMMELLVEK